MTNSIQTEIDNVRAKLAELENLAKVQEELAGLPVKYGFSNLNSFIKALKRAAGPAKPGRASKAAKTGETVEAASDAPAPKATKAKKGKKGKRARITPEIKEQVKAAIAEGKTGSAIAKELGISLPSVQNIKKEFGLVKERSK